VAQVMMIDDKDLDILALETMGLKFHPSQPHTHTHTQHTHSGTHTHVVTKILSYGESLWLVAAALADLVDF